MNCSHSKKVWVTPLPDRLKSTHSRRRRRKESQISSEIRPESETPYVVSYFLNELLTLRGSRGERGLAVVQMPHDVRLKLRVKMRRDARFEPRLGPFIIALGD